MNRGSRYRDEIGCAAVGESVLAFRTTRHTHSTEAEWLDRITSGAVRLNGRRVACDEVLRIGQMLEIGEPAPDIARNSLMLSGICERIGCPQLTGNRGCVAVTVAAIRVGVFNSPSLLAVPP